MEITDKEYKKCKLLIKSWEKKFKVQNNRTPAKNDIKNAPRTVRDAYKTYWYAKTSLLEETIVDDEKEATANKGIRNEANDSNVNTSSVKITHNETKNSFSCEDIVTETSQMKLREITAALGNESSEPKKVPEFINSESVWGDHLKKAAIKNNEMKAKKSSSSQFTEKLFKGLKFKKRNPRKSFISTDQSKPSENTKTDKNDSHDSITDVPPFLLDSQEADDSVFVFDCPNVKITAGKSFTFSEPVSILRDAEKQNDVRMRINNKLDQGWLERCNRNCNFIGDTDSSSNVDIIEKRDNDNSPLSSDDDYVYSSEDESSKKVKNLPSFRKSLSDEGMSNTLHEEVSLNESLTKAITNSQKYIDLNLKVTSTTLNNNNSTVINKDEIGQKRITNEEDLKPNKRAKLNINVDFDTQCKLRQLEQKISSGKLNENFVSININRKRYVRGKKTATFSKYKKQQWKMKKKYNSMESNCNSTGVMKCFKCGDVGHFAKQCRKKNSLLLPLEEYSDTEESPFPTLEEAAEMAHRMNKANYKYDSVEDESQQYDSLEQPELQKLTCVAPLYECNEDETIKGTSKEVFDALQQFGYEEFRPGQEKVIMRILSGKSTLFISGTGSGKSLCYQIPAYLYALRSPCISLIISPLVSLMEDQVLNFPWFLNAACLHTNQTTQQRGKILEKLKSNKLSVLLISPEAMVSGERGILGRDFIKNFPPIAFVCIDEVHCVSQWSHNFRTSYLLLCNILRERFKVRTLLGLTATATSSTIRNVTQHLGVADDKEAVLQESILPENLILSASADEEKDAALLKLLTRPPFSEYDSIIVYCLRRNECERLATFLRTSLQGTGRPLQKFNEKETVSRNAEVYHAGISAAKRKKVQKYFMEGKIRIVVATVAFGMGINKADIRGIIHYNLPRTFEHYVQEVGRAGRDGKEARCHLFYDAKGGDIPELKRHVYSNSVDRHVIRKLLQNVFVPCQCKNTCEKHEIAFSIDTTVKTLDLNQENISTLLCYLELLPKNMVQTLPSTYTICSVQSYDGVLPLQRAAKKCAPLAYVIAEHTKRNGSLKAGDKIEFPVMKLANKIKWDSGVVKYELKSCEWTEVNGKYKKSGIIINFSDVGFHVKSAGNLSEAELDEALDALHNRVKSQENLGLFQLKICNRAFKSIAYANVNDYLMAADLKIKSDNLKCEIKKYFVEDLNSECSKSDDISLKNEVSVMCEIHRLVSNHRDCTFTGRTIARIFHGIESPNFPAQIWYRSPFWRCELKEDFNALMKLASRELITLR